jgi:hypothetical protein
MLNLMLFNKNSEIRDLERSQAFSVLVIQTDAVESVSIGPKNALIVPMGATIAPTYISPDPAILAGLVQNSETLREDLFRMAEQHGVSGVRSEASGVSLAWRFFGHGSQLKKTASIATSYEQAVMHLFGLWTRTDFTYSVQYPTEYQPGDSGVELSNLKAAGELPGSSRLMQKHLAERAARLILRDEDASVLNEIVDSIYSETDEPEEGAKPIGFVRTNEEE